MRFPESTEEISVPRGIIHTAECDGESASRTSHFIHVNPSPCLTAHGPSLHFPLGGQNADMHANSQLYGVLHEGLISVVLNSSVNAHRST